MKELLDAFNARIKAPLLGNYVLGVFIINWKAFLTLFLSDGWIENRITAFESQISIGGFLWLPLFFAVAASFLQPFAALAGAWIAFWPAHKRRLLQLKSDSAFENTKLRTVIERRRLERELEVELIGQAQRDKEISDLSDDRVRENLQNQIDELRNRGTANGSAPKKVAPQKLSQTGLEMLEHAARGGGKIKVQRYLNGTSVRAGNQTTDPSSKLGSSAPAEGALRELERHSLIRSETEDRSSFVLTEKGYSVAAEMDD